jgi:excinuclease Cho
MRTRVTSVGLIILPDPYEHFEYPAHINRACLEALPHKPGVYFFRGRDGVPIYIGKSINIRSRVLSHLRTAEEAAMLRDSHTVDFVRTAGEIGALLLESHLVKKLQPFYNVKLREYAEVFSLHLAPGETRPLVIGSTETDLTAQDDLFGLFASRRTAEEGLRALVRQHMLCPALTGLETVIHNRACFARQLRRCMGACIGEESLDAHHARLRAALQGLQTSVWPYAGPIGIVEESDGLRQIHVVNRWSYLGSLEGRRKKLRMPARQFIDIDIYKILVKPLSNGELDIVTVTPSGNIQ